eukprot:TRINITY_DN43603_c0_g1_i1.p1 TRINITY_DN43603_c0_g1~~TRINITY_DN43603_c0_g1_i1.p1  ORF type:complete len:250 (+),score=53.07 TRINITY_DN43603_c0_g1_i1:143-892(+)
MTSVDQAFPESDSTGMSVAEALRERFTRALHELAHCRDLLDSREIPHESSMSCDLKDHSDVLQVVSPPALSPHAAAAAASSGSPARAGVAAVGAPSTSSGGGGVGAFAVAAAPIAASATAALPASDVEDRRERERLEEELSMAKALLMLSNVSLSMDLDVSDGAEPPPAQVINLKGSRRLIQCLIAMKQKISLLNQQYLLLRGDVLYLSHEMSVCRHWVMQSFRTAMQHQTQEHTSLQSRFERLSKVLN